MPLLDGFNKAIEKAGQGISSAKQSIGDVAHGFTENIQKSKNEKQPNKGDPQKCPQCGQLLNGLTAVCPMCGYEFRSEKNGTAIKDLTKEIERIEKKRHVIGDALSSRISGKETNPTDERIASLIRNFIVPNTKEDIFEFMLLAAGNIDSALIAGRKATEGVSEIITKAWNSKFEQTFQKAKISFGEDVDFRKIQEVYDKKMQEIESTKPFFKRRK